jgi:hypothetical protein
VGGCGSEETVRGRKNEERRKEQETKKKEERRNLACEDIESKRESLIERKGDLGGSVGEEGEKEEEEDLIFWIRNSLS